MRQVDPFVTRRAMAAALKPLSSTHTIHVVAQSARVSKLMLVWARLVRRHAIPAVIEAAEHGQIAMRAAATIARLPADQQLRALQEVANRRRNAHGHAIPERQRQRTGNSRVQIERVVSGLAVSAENLHELAKRLNGEAPVDARLAWGSALRKTRRALGTIIHTLEGT